MLPGLICKARAGLCFQLSPSLCIMQVGTLAVAMDTKDTQVVHTGLAVGSLLRNLTALTQVGRVHRGVCLGPWLSDGFLGTSSAR